MTSSAMQRGMKSSISSDALGVGIGMLYYSLEFFHEGRVARPTACGPFVGADVFAGELGELFGPAEAVVAFQKLADAFDVFGRDDRLPLTQRARRYFEACFCGHKASAERGVGEGFLDQGATGGRLFDIVLAVTADGEAATSGLCADE